MVRLPFLLLALLLLPLAGGADPAPEIDEDADHRWVPQTGTTLEWVVAGCPESRSDVVRGMQQIEDELDRVGVYPRFERKIGIEPDAHDLRVFSDPNAGTLLVQDITGRAGADIVIGCVPADVFDNITRTRGYEDVLGITLYSYTWDRSREVHLYTAAVIILPEGQHLAAEGCHDPQPIGHALRRVTVMHEALHAAGLGRHARDAGVFEDAEAENRSCSAWWVPQSEQVGKETRERLQDTWGSRPGPGILGAVGASMVAHPGWWIGIPAVVAAAAVGWLAVQRVRAIQAERKRVQAGIRRLDGTIGKRPSATSGIQSFRPQEEVAPIEPELPPQDELPGWGYANRGKHRRE